MSEITTKEWEKLESIASTKYSASSRQTGNLHRGMLQEVETILQDFRKNKGTRIEDRGSQPFNRSCAGG